MADHDDGHRAEADAQPIHVGDEVAAEELGGVGEGDEERDHARNRADHERAPPHRLDDRRGREIDLRRVRDVRRGAHSDPPFPDFVFGITCGKVAPLPGSTNSGALDGIALALRDVGRGGVLAQLQRPDVGGNAPAITGRNLRGIILHDAVSVGHHVEEIADRSFHQPLNVIRRRLFRETPGWDEAVAIPESGVARRTVDVVTLAAAVHYVLRYGERHVLARGVADLAGIEIGVGAFIAAGHGSFDQGPSGALVGKEIALGQRVVARLHVHIETAASGAYDGQQEQSKRTDDTIAAAGIALFGGETPP